MIATHVKTTGFDVIETVKLVNADIAFASESGHNPFVPTAGQVVAMQEQQRGDGRKKGTGSFKFACFNCDGDHSLRECEETRDEATIKKNRKKGLLQSQEEAA